MAEQAISATTAPPPTPRPYFGYKLPKPRTILQIAQLINTTGLQCAYPPDSEQIQIGELHGIKVLITTPQGETKEVFLAIMGFEPNELKNDQNG